MNNYVRLLILKSSDSNALLLFGYGLPDSENEPRPWAIGEVGRRLQLYQVSCVMKEEEFAAFEESLVQEEPVVLQSEKTFFCGWFYQTTGCNPLSEEGFLESE